MTMIYPPQNTQYFCSAFFSYVDSFAYIELFIFYSQQFKNSQMLFTDCMNYYSLPHSNNRGLAILDIIQYICILLKLSVRESIRIFIIIIPI